MTTRTTKWVNKYRMGKVDGENIYLSAPSWDCDRYWGFGYLGNKNCHYHLDGLADGRNINMYDAIKQHFGESLTIPDEKLWIFCELVLTTYTLRETAQVLGKGDSHFANNPCAEIIKNETEAKRINDVVLPAIFDAIHDLLSSTNN